MVFINISVYRDSKKILDKDLKVNRKFMEHTSFLLVAPFMLKSWFVALVIANPVLLRYQGFLSQLATRGFLHDNYNYCICQLMIIANEIGADGMKVVEIILKNLLME